LQAVTVPKWIKTIPEWKIHLTHARERNRNGCRDTEIWEIEIGERGRVERWNYRQRKVRDVETGENRNRYG